MEKFDELYKGEEKVEKRWTLHIKLNMINRTNGLYRKLPKYHKKSNLIFYTHVY